MKTNLPPSVSAAVLADLIGVSPRSITDLARRGIVVRAEQGKGFDLQRSVRGQADHLRKLATGRGGEGAIASATAERARLLRAQADSLEAKNARERGALLDSAAVDRTWSDIVRQSRAAVLAVSSRCQARLPHLTAHDVNEIDLELRDVLRQLGEGGADGTA